MECKTGRGYLEIRQEHELLSHKTLSTHNSQECNLTRFWQLRGMPTGGMACENK